MGEARGVLDVRPLLESADFDDLLSPPMRHSYRPQLAATSTRSAEVETRKQQAERLSL